MIFPTDILRTVAEEAHVSVDDLTGPGRAREFSYPRHVAVVLLHERCGCNFARIGRLLGGRDTETAAEAYRRTKARMERPGLHRDMHDRVVARLAALEPAE